jgi:sterol desaturase/sphingolipid hydroxylase (fatty acid hydroxylase superfamily)
MPPPHRLTGFLLQPVALAITLLLVGLSGGSLAAYRLAIIGSQILLRVVERLMPLHPQWRQRRRDIIEILILTFIGLAAGVLIEQFYVALFALIPGALRTTATALWPRDMPLLLQVILVFCGAELIYYWVHRTVHHSSLLWRITGHGCHHSFHNMHAINFLTAHPLELLMLVLPTALLGGLFGLPESLILGSLTIGAVNGGMAHANLFLNPRSTLGIMTSSSHHQRHHSQQLQESNSNFSCNLILFDRLFGTFSSGFVQQTGTGPREPNLVNKLMLHFGVAD